jgi:hypothetical protein
MQFRFARLIRSGVKYYKNLDANVSKSACFAKPLPVGLGSFHDLQSIRLLRLNLEELRDLWFA